MKKVCFITELTKWGRGHRVRMKSLKKFYESAGWETCWTNPKAEDKTTQLKGSSHVYIWNGSDNSSGSISWEARSLGARLFCVENGHFPQSQFNVVSEDGLYGRHPARNMDWDSLLSQDHWDSFHQRRMELSIWRNPIRSNLVPLQVDNDVTVVLYGNGYKNRDLMEMDLGVDKWVRNHPKGRRYSLDSHTDDRPNLNQVLGSYEKIVGINSTVLYEASLMGIPTQALGQSYFDWHKDPDIAMCALLAMQIPIYAQDFSPWMKEGLGLEHLNEL